MTLTFTAIVGLIFGAEGGYDVTPSDPGNWTGGVAGAGTLRGTKYGISAASYPTLDVAGLTLDQATAIYRADYWARIAGDDLPGQVALLIFDAAVNQGVGAAARALQASAGVAVDGVVGPQTIAAVRQYADVPGLLAEITARRAQLYAGTARFNLFGLGWMRRAAGMMRAALAA